MMRQVERWITAEIRQIRQSFRYILRVQYLEHHHSDITSCLLIRTPSRAEPGMSLERAHRDR